MAKQQGEYPVIEAPRWLLGEAADSGLIVDPDITHLLPFPSRDPRSTAVQFEMRTRQYGAGVMQTLYSELLVDLPQSSFALEFTVAVDYPREAEPYDAALGLTIHDTHGRLAPLVPNMVATDAQIANDGRNLIMLHGSTNGYHEFMAFRSATDLGGGLIRLDLVWRGLMDTPPMPHVAGSYGHFIDANMIGRRGWSVLKPIECQLVPRSQSVVGSGGDPIKVLTIAERRARCILPLPPSNVSVSGEGCYGATGMPAVFRRFKSVTLLEEGVEMYGIKRDRLSPVLRRGDEAEDQTGDFTSYLYSFEAIGYDRVPLRVYSDDSGTSGISGVLGRGNWKLDGHGYVWVGIDVLTSIPSGIGGGLYGHAFVHAFRNPRVKCYAPLWRNLLANVRWNYANPGNGGDASWVTVAGTHTVGSNSFSLSRAATGKNSYYLISTGGSPMTIQQTCEVAKWRPRGLTAVVVGYIRNNVDTTDTGQLSIDAIDNFLTVLATSSGSATAGATGTWTRIQHSMTLPAGTTAVVARLSSAEVAGGGGGAGPDTAWSELELRVGQFLANVLSNYSFETGTVSSWTVAGGAFVVATAIASPSANYAQGGAAATSSIFQEYVLPAGWEVGSEAFVTAFRAQTVDNDRGELKIEAMDAISNVLAVGSTGMENILTTSPIFTTLNQWVRRTVYCGTPEGTTKIRVTFIAERFIGAGNSGACIDEVALWISKHVRVGDTGMHA